MTTLSELAPPYRKLTMNTSTWTARKFKELVIPAFLLRIPYTTLEAKISKLEVIVARQEGQLKRRDKLIANLKSQLFAKVGSI